MRASTAFEADAPGVDGVDFGYAPRGAERLAELYYAWQVNEHLEVTPDLQWIARPGADGTAEDITVVACVHDGILNFVRWEPC